MKPDVIYLQIAIYHFEICQMYFQQRRGLNCSSQSFIVTKYI